MNTTSSLSFPVFIDASFNNGLITVSIFDTSDRTEREVCNFTNAFQRTQLRFPSQKASWPNHRSPSNGLNQMGH